MREEPQLWEKMVVVWVEGGGLALGKDDCQWKLLRVEGEDSAVGKDDWFITSGYGSS